MRVMGDDLSMKRDWDSRALENAKWYINTVGVDQSDEAFFQSGKDELLKWWLPDFREALVGRDLKSLRVFENGCGIGRMTCHLAEVFGEVWAVDVSGEMIRQARERFPHLGNIRWIETEGTSLKELPDSSFDFGFSIYVYQHMPSKDLISKNIRAAFSKLKPDGLYKLHTNGLENEEYEEVVKNTWIGATFTVREIRALAKELGAQLVAIQGSGTQYCWSTLRRRSHASPPPVSPESERKIEALLIGRASDLRMKEIPSSGDEARIGIVVRGLSREVVDCNSVSVKVGERATLPIYVGFVRERYRELVSAQISSPLDELTYIEIGVPAGTGPGFVRVGLQHGGAFSNEMILELSVGEEEPPKIVTIRNGLDYGTDVHTVGPKSLLNLYVDGLDESAATCNVTLTLGDVEFAPDFVGFVPENGTWQVNAQLPPGIEPGPFDLRLCFQGRESLPTPVILLSAEKNELGSEKA